MLVMTCNQPPGRQRNYLDWCRRFHSHEVRLLKVTRAVTLLGQVAPGLPQWASSPEHNAIGCIRVAPVSVEIAKSPTLPAMPGLTCEVYQAAQLKPVPLLLSRFQVPRPDSISTRPTSYFNSHLGVAFLGPSSEQSSPSLIAALFCKVHTIHIFVF